MRGRGGGEGGLGTISSELLLWVSMARERRGEERLKTKVTIPNTVPTQPQDLPQEPLPASPLLPGLSVWGRDSLRKARTSQPDLDNELPRKLPAPHHSCLLTQDPTFATRKIRG